MKQKDKEEWIDDVLQSMQGSRRAQPTPDLFDRIEEQISLSNIFQPKEIQLIQWKYAAAAAILVFLLNTTAVMYYGQNNGIHSEDLATAEPYIDQSLISMSKIYD